YNPDTRASAASAVIAAATFTNVTVPTVSGTAQVGTQLSSTNGSWSQTPDSFSYQWLENNNSCSNGSFPAISGATSSAYTPVAGDVGHCLKLQVTAIKAGYTSVVAS